MRLLCIGETPDLRTVCIPSKYGPTSKEIPINLAKFDFNSLETFLKNEEPYIPPKSSDIKINLHSSDEELNYMTISELYSNILT